jgi:hypothetical protein
MALKREQKSVLKLAAITVAFTVLLLQSILPFVGGRKDPTAAFVTILAVEALLFSVAFWVTGKRDTR